MGLLKRRRYATYPELIRLVEDEAVLSGHDVQAVLDVLKAHGVDVEHLVKIEADEEVPE